MVIRILQVVDSDSESNGRSVIDFLLYNFLGTLISMIYVDGRKEGTFRFLCVLLWFKYFNSDFGFECGPC